VGADGGAAGAGRPDLVIVAAAARRFDGLRILAGLRSAPETRALPVLAICDGKDRAQALAALDLGAQDILYDPVDEDELASRVLKMVKRKRYVDAMRRLLDRGLELAVTDQLTGLNNRRYLVNQLQGLVVRAARGGEPVSLVMTDIDHFKIVNDVHGHDAGDQVLRELAARLSVSLRPGDVPCRLGGEEFVIIMPNTTEDLAVMAAERLRRDVSSTPFLVRDGELLAVTASFGVAGSGPESFSVERLLKRADEALYRAKQAGRNRVAAAA
jgi:two-component system cell cycle response regulator